MTADSGSPRLLGRHNQATKAKIATDTTDLVDECHLFLHPVIVGGGKPAFRAALRRDLELLETRRFASGAIHLRYRMRGATTR
jgi:dihydrofolate reductase